MWKEVEGHAQGLVWRKAHVGAVAAHYFVPRQRLVFRRVGPLPFGLRLIQLLFNAAAVLELPGVFAVVDRPLGFRVALLELASVAAVGIRIAPALLAAVGISPLNDGHAVFGVALRCFRLQARRFLPAFLRFGSGLVQARTRRTLNELGRHFLKVVDYVSGRQVSHGLLVGQELKNLLGAQVEPGAEHLLAVF